MLKTVKQKFMMKLVVIQALIIKMTLIWVMGPNQKLHPNDWEQSNDVAYEKSGIKYYFEISQFFCKKVWLVGLQKANIEEAKPLLRHCAEKLFCFISLICVNECQNLTLNQKQIR